MFSAFAVIASAAFDTPGNPLECGPANIGIVERACIDHTVRGVEHGARAGQLRSASASCCIDGTCEHAPRGSVRSHAQAPLSDAIHGASRPRIAAVSRDRLAPTRIRIACDEMTVVSPASPVSAARGGVESFDQVLQPRGRAQPVRRRAAGISILCWIGKHGSSGSVLANLNLVVSLNRVALYATPALNPRIGSRYGRPARPSR